MGSARVRDQKGMVQDGRSCYPGPMRGMSWCSDSVDRYLFNSSTRCLCVLAPPSRRSRSSSCDEKRRQYVHTGEADGTPQDRLVRAASISLTLFRLISSCLRCASVFPVPVLLGIALLLLLLLPSACSSSSSSSIWTCRASAVLLLLSAGLFSSLAASPSSLAGSTALFFLLLLLLFFFFLIPPSFAPPFSFSPPETVEV